MRIDMGDKKRSSDYLGISEKRIEELKRITTDMMSSMTTRLDNNISTLDVVELIITLENRKDMTEREKILCSFQMGMNAQRLLKKGQYET